MPFVTRKEDATGMRRVRSDGPRGHFPLRGEHDYPETRRGTTRYGDNDDSGESDLEDRQDVRAPERRSDSTTEIHRADDAARAPPSRAHRPCRLHRREDPTRPFAREGHH